MKKFAIGLSLDALAVAGTAMAEQAGEIVARLLGE